MRFGENWMLISNNNSKERQIYLAKKKRKRNLILAAQIGFVLFVILIWEVLALSGIIDSFIMSSPSRMIKTIFNLSENNFLTHIFVTVYETIAGFSLGAILGVLIATLLWWSKTLTKIAEPFLVVLNSLPKVALGPVIIIWVGAGTKAIIVMALAISLVVTILDMLSGFNSTDVEKIRMARTFGANRGQIFTKIVFPSNIDTLFNSLKINIGLSLVGVISGEFLVSKAGLGYLIVYAGQVFKMDIVMASVLILGIVAALMYRLVCLVQNFVTKRLSH